MGRRFVTQYGCTSITFSDHNPFTNLPPPSTHIIKSIMSHRDFYTHFVRFYSVSIGHKIIVSDAHPLLHFCLRTKIPPIRSQAYSSLPSYSEQTTQPRATAGNYSTVNGLDGLPPTGHNASTTLDSISAAASAAVSINLDLWLNTLHYG